MEYKKILQTVNVGIGKNTMEYIVIHHTGTAPGTTEGNLNTLLGLNNDSVSCHYLIGSNGDTYKLAKDTDICFHCGNSNWEGRTNLNRYSIGIELVGPGFTDKQKERLKELLLYLTEKLNIPKENIIRHKDIAPGRKVDVDDSLWNKEFKTFRDYIDSLFIMGEYETLFTNNYGKGTVFNDLDGALKKCINEDGSLNAREFFFLTMIGLERVNNTIKPIT